MEKLVVYPGSFDPITYGHLDIVDRGLAVFGKLIVAVAHNPQKDPLFSLAERKEMVIQATNRDPRVTVDDFGGLLVDYLHQVGAHVVLRGLRAVSDFEYEFQMALMNRRQDLEVETVFMMTTEAYSFLSSKLIKEIASLGGSVKGLVPEVVAEKLKEKLATKGGIR